MTWKARDRELQSPQGEVLPYQLEHNQERREDADFWPDGRACLRLRAEAGALTGGELVYHTGEALACAPLVCQHRDATLEVWQALFAPPAEPFDYYFRLQTISGPAYLGQTGLQASLPYPVRFRFQPGAPLDTPPWARGANFYQIFPDRFHRMGAAGDCEAWDVLPTATGRKGGNLAGVTAKLDYLRDLGVDALYLNPIFSSPSPHRYDTLDFFQIDPMLGDLDDLRALVSRAHGLGMRVILDGVFNHVSEHHPFFRDVLARGPASPHWDWFELRGWPIDGEAAYSMWWGHPHLPELHVEHPAVQDYLLSVATHWIEAADIDGWRLDVAGELPLAFWRRLRRRVRALKPDAYLLGEFWGDSRPYVQGDSFDATMNYPFRRAVLGFLNGESDADAFARDLSRLYYRLPRSAAEAQYNLLGSHDVSRLITALGGKQALVEMAFALQTVYPGAAALYYGDELGLPGGEDPDCRRAYLWPAEEAGGELLAHVRRLYRARSGSRLLREGSFRCLAEGRDRVVLERRLAGERLTLWVDRAAATWELSGLT